MNENQQIHQLLRIGYINVTGMTCLSYGQEGMRFRVPTASEYPDLKHISGDNFIFVLLKNGQTWFKDVDLSIVSRAATLYYHDGIKIVAMDGSRNPVNTQGTVMFYPFEFEQGELEKRKLDPDCVIVEKSSHVISSAAIMKIISDAINRSVTNCLNRLFMGGKDLKQFPNQPFLEAFNSTLVQDVPLPDNHLRSFYMMVILQAQIEGKFPYNLSHQEFIDLVEIPQPPMRYKEGIVISAAS